MLRVAVPIKPFLNCSVDISVEDGSGYPGVPQPEHGAVGHLQWMGVGIEVSWMALGCGS